MCNAIFNGAILLIALVAIRLIETEVLGQVAPDNPDRLTVEKSQSAEERLTAYGWGDPEKTHIQFYSDGTYLLKVHTDVPFGGCPVGVPNFERNGIWRLKWSKDHGLVQWETGEALAVAFSEEELFLGLQGWLPSFPKIPAKPVDGNAKALGDLSSNSLYQMIANTRWRKSDPFNLFMYPTQIHFDDAGRFHAVYRNGECSSDGSWSLTRGGTKLGLVPDPNACDQRGNGTASIGSNEETPAMHEGMLVFYGASYFPEDAPADSAAFTFDAYSGTVRLTGKYQGALKKGTPTSIEWVFTANGTYQLESLKIEQWGAVIDGQSVSTEGESTVLLEIPLDRQLTSEEPYRVSKSITPTLSGDVFLTCTVRFRSPQQPFASYKNFFVQIAQ
ncbi:MAG: hypothetical protein WCI02_06735 [Planctomycetota bacterium]|jgi:hypothetical protein